MGLFSKEIKKAVSEVEQQRADEIATKSALTSNEALILMEDAVNIERDLVLIQDLADRGFKFNILKWFIDALRRSEKPKE